MQYYCKQWQFTSSRGINLPLITLCRRSVATFQVFVASVVLADVVAKAAGYSEIELSDECGLASAEAEMLSGAPLESAEELELQAMHCFSLYGFQYVVVSIEPSTQTHAETLRSRPLSFGVCAPIRCSGSALHSHLRDRLPYIAGLDTQTPIQVVPLSEALLRPRVHACESDGSLAWTRSKEICVLGACDFYSAGGGEECMVTDDGLGSNSCTFSQRGSEILHCPLSAPLALLVVPKAASSSAVEWLSHVDGGLRTRLQNLLSEEEAPELDTWFPDRLFIRFFKELKQLTNCKYDEILLHFKRLIDMSQHGAYYLRGPYCSTCCQHGTGRLRAVLVRNPFARVAALFRSHGAHVTTSFADFANIVADGVRNGFAAFSASTSHMFATHATSILSLFRKGDVAPGKFLVLHLETLAGDLEHLARHLCEDFAYCEYLPTFPVLNVDLMRQSSSLDPLPNESAYMSTASMMWPHGVVASIVNSFGEDFEAFGYSKDPSNLAPVSTGEEMFFDWTR